MSILSCDEFVADRNKVTLTVRDNALVIDLAAAPRLEGTSGFVISNGSGASNSITITPGGNLNLGNGYVGSVTSNTLSQYGTVGYRLFFHRGFLKCVKREIAYYQTLNVVSTSSTYHLQDSNSPKQKARETFYHPAVILEVMTTKEARETLKNRLIEFSRKRGIEVPHAFRDVGPLTLDRSFDVMSVIDWLSYPLLREINNPCMCYNTAPVDREIMAPSYEPMNFKELVQHYFGTITSKMLEEIWKVVVVGNDYAVRRFDSEMARTAYMAYGNTRFLKDNGDHVIEAGNKKFQVNVFTLGVAIFKALGFDYFYQCINKFATVSGSPGSAGMLTPNYQRAAQLEMDFATLLKSITPKKLIGALFAEDALPDTHNLYDACRMIREYEPAQSIPKKLKTQYPNGLRVDFKFKTIKELHDKISTQYTIIKTESNNREIPISPEYMCLDRRERDGLTLVVPDNTSTLAIWGKLLNICIASYGDRAARGDTLLLGVEKEGKIKYCLEFYSLPVEIIRPMESIVAGIFEEGKAPEDALVETVRVAYPRLIQRHMGVTPSDIPEEEEYFYELSEAQFRGERNGDPTKEDRAAVYYLLNQWVQENKERLEKIKGIFEERGNQWHNGAQLNEQMLQGVLQQVQNHYAIPDQIMLNPQAYQAYQNVFNNNVVMDPGPPPIFNGQVNMVVNPYIPPGEVWAVDADGVRFQPVIQNVVV
jgi:hypothetical protein